VFRIKFAGTCRGSGSLHCFACSGFSNSAQTRGGEWGDESDDSSGVFVDVDESVAVDAVVTFPAGCKVDIGFFKVVRCGITLPRQAGSEDQ
jgi:hypothetical protein